MKFWKIFNNNKELKKHKKIRLGLALGGGASRGIAHIGALKAFEEAGITFDFIAGTSAGALIGGVYSAGVTISQLENIAKSTKTKDIRTSNFILFPSSTDSLEKLIVETVGNINIEDTKIPFGAVAVDLISSSEIVIDKGNLAKAICGSCAVPGVFVPVIYNDMHLADGGLQNNIPSDVPRLFDCDYVIAVDVNSTRGEGTESIKMKDVLLASLRILMKSNSVKGYINADIVIKPKLKQYKSTQIDNVDEIIEEGYNATKSRIDDILKIISKKPKKKKIITASKLIADRNKNRD